jgi:signal transduction histidine kinase
MSRIRSMRGETSAIIIIALMLSHIAGYLIYTLDRRDALEMTEAADLAERAAGISRLLRDLPSAWRDEVVTLSDSRTFRVWSGSEPALDLQRVTVDEGEIVTYLRTQVPRISGHDMRVRFVDRSEARAMPPAFDHANRAGSPASSLDEPEIGPGIAISIRHSEEEWINFLGALSTPKSLLPELLLANIVSAVVGIALVAFWLVGRVTRPLRNFADAAEGLGQDLFRPPLAIKGPTEVSVAAEAFNRMQRRLARLIQSRTEMLAAISHDLRTPLTQLRLRLEMAPESRDREKSLRAIDDMDATIGTFLAYARASHGSEDKSRVNLSALIGSICDDLADCGSPVEWDCDDGLVVRVKRLAIKRALNNLIDNALKYGNEAHVSAVGNGRVVTIRVTDTGPGIPEHEMSLVLRPFHRGGGAESGANSNGSGLGLAIAQAIVEDHGGELRLLNQEQGGLCAEILLPQQW